MHLGSISVSALRAAALAAAVSPARRRAGFTLFEVALSLGLLTFGIVSVMMLFPMGLKAQQMSRFQLYAAAKAEEMVEQFTSTHPDNATTDSEGSDPWEAADSYRSQAWDLEARLNSHRYGIMALPNELARRLDSDGNEIQQILSQGGLIYYAQPMAGSDTEEQAQAQAPPQEVQKLIIGITGYAQQNSLHMFPLKNWPYTTATPSPPLHSVHLYDSWLPPVKRTTGGGYYNVYQWPAGGGEDWLYPWECTCIPGVAIPGTDKDMQKVFDWSEAAGSTNLPFVTGQITHYGYFPYACGPNVNFYDGITSSASTTQNVDSCIRYVQSALWYCQQKSLQSPSITATFWNPASLPAAGQIPSFEANTPDNQKWMQVQAMRFLSHAATCLTGWFPATAFVPNPNNVPDLTTGVTIPQVTLDGLPGPPTQVITGDMIHYYHERAVRLMMEFAARFPYDWAVPRPIERSIMIDYPLLQYDMFSTSLTGTVFGTGAFGSGLPAQSAFQWHVLSPRPIKNIGLGQIYPVNQTPEYHGPPPNPMGGQNKLDPTIAPGTVNRLMGNLDHYTLGKPFDASERCREIVFWTVDWQSYEDFETLPSATIDASKYPIAGPRMAGTGSSTGASTYRRFEDRMWDVDFVDPHLYAYRNPEKTELFYDATPSTLPSGSSTNGHELLNGGNPDKGSGLYNRQVFSGLFGADRNFNQKIDRGPVPKSVRLRAISVARFNYYDPRIPCLLR